jgi:hypothetical protein
MRKPSVSAANDSDNPELLLGSALFLMSSFAIGKPSAQLRFIIQRHLECLADHERLGSTLRDLCDRMSLDWSQLVAENSSNQINPKVPPRLWCVK